MPTITEFQGQPGTSFPTFEEMLAQAERASPQPQVVIQPNQPVQQVQLSPPQRAQRQVVINDEPPPFQSQYTKEQFRRMTPQQYDRAYRETDARFRSYQQAVQQWRFHQQAQKLATMQKNQENVQGIPAIGNQLNDVAEQLKEHPGDPVKFAKDTTDLQKLFTRASDLVAVDRGGSYVPRPDVISNTTKLPLAISKADELNEKKDKLQADSAAYSALLKNKYFLENQARGLGFDAMPSGLTNAAAGNAFMFRQPPAINGTGRVAAPQSAGLSDMIEMLRKQGVPEASIKALQERWIK